MLIGKHSHGQHRRYEITNVTYRILGDVSASSLIVRIVCADIAIDVQHGCGATGTEDYAKQVELVGICIVGT